MLHHWSALANARARNRHRAAQQVCARFGGESRPSQVAADAARRRALPRRGGGAVAGARATRTILDGNVKRVIARCLPCPVARRARSWPPVDDRRVALTPSQRVAQYNQAMMDLGATVCTRASQTVPQCPLVADCVAHRQRGRSRLSGKKPRKDPCRSGPVRMLLVRDRAGAVLLERRPPSSGNRAACGACHQIDRGRTDGLVPGCVLAECRARDALPACRACYQPLPSTSSRLKSAGIDQVASCWRIEYHRLGSVGLTPAPRHPSRLLQEIAG